MTVFDWKIIAYQSTLAVIGGLLGIVTARLFARWNYAFIRELPPFVRRIYLWPYFSSRESQTDDAAITAMERGTQFPFSIVSFLGLLALTVSAIELYSARHQGRLHPMFFAQVIFFVVGSGSVVFGIGLLRFAGRFAASMMLRAHTRPKLEQIPLCSGLPVFLFPSAHRTLALGLYYRAVGLAFIGMGAVLCTSGYAISH